MGISRYEAMTYHGSFISRSIPSGSFRSLFIPDRDALRN